MDLSPVFPIAFSEINANKDNITGGLRLAYVFGQDSECEAQSALMAMVSLISEFKVDAVIGPACSVGCELTGLQAARRNLTEISYSCTSPVLSNKDRYPTFSR